MICGTTGCVSYDGDRAHTHGFTSTADNAMGTTSMGGRVVTGQGGSLLVDCKLVPLKHGTSGRLLRHCRCLRGFLGRDGRFNTRERRDRGGTIDVTLRGLTHGSNCKSIAHLA